MNNPRPQFQLQWESEIVECGSNKDTAWEGWTTKGARELHGLFCEEAALGTQLRCNHCKELSKAKTGGDAASGMVAGIEGHCFTMTSAMYWKGWEHWRIPRLKECVRQLHLFKHKRRMLEYLEAVRACECQNGLKNTLRNYFNSGMTLGTCLQAFSEPDDALGYGDKSVSRNTITEVFIEFSTDTRQIESANYLKSLSAICASLDNTFKTTNKATLTNKDGQKMKEIKGSILTVLNEGNEIISWRFCQMRTNAEIAELLLGLKHHHDVLGLLQPKMMVANNCCHICGAVASAMPETEAKLDVWHFSARCTQNMDVQQNTGIMVNKSSAFLQLLISGLRKVCGQQWLRRYTKSNSNMSEKGVLSVQINTSGPGKTGHGQNG
ncbi:hypothetical protein EDB19DRAFT_1835779 [Suillus lakei]|nr:hypothetical protein EDB19DRAFT_1835779 [Suillus lakei]